MTNSRPDLVVMVGAGASMPCGIPSTADLTSKALGVISSAAARSMLEEALRGAYGDFDFELIIHALESLLLFVASPGVSSRDARPIMSAFADMLGRYRGLCDPSAISEYLREVIRSIHTTIGDATSLTWSKEAKNARDEQERLLVDLAREFRLIVIDLNYDTLYDDLPISWRDGFVRQGTTHPFRVFDPLDLEHAMASTNDVLMHLHGSSRFSYASAGVMSSLTQFSEQVCYDDHLTARGVFAGTFGSVRAVSGEYATAYPIISGLGKVTKLVHNMRPYGHYQAAACKALVQTPRLLVVGYGGRDDYVNSWISEFTAIHGVKRRAAVILRRKGSEVGEYTPKEKLLQILAGLEGWRAIETVAFKGSASKTIWVGGNLYFVPSGAPFNRAYVKSMSRFLQSGGTALAAPIVTPTAALTAALP